MADAGITIRDPSAADEAAWRKLWSGYNAFYEADIPEAVTAHTWQRLLGPVSTMFARLAVINGEVAGFSLCIVHDSSWTIRSYCYLEDLFVAPKFRSRGCGRALIQDLVDRAKANGWSRLYWHTRATNPARRLYDEFTPADDFVRYRLSLK
jgi:GNAT superfamily N-acetyltransferase